MNTIVLLLFVAVMISLMAFSIVHIYREKQLAEQRKNKIKYKGLINKLNHNNLVANATSSLNSSHLEVIFNRAKNPWRMTIATFQFIRYGGFAICLLFFAILFFINKEASLFVLGLGILCYWYPMYYYVATGNEREAEWNKFYEFIWVLKHNLMLYDPAKAFMNVKIYIAEHTPHNKEIIQGFDDFYRYWDPDEISPYINRFYAFSVTREIYQIVFNMSKTGEFPEDSLNSLRSFIINAQNLTVEKTLSAVSGKATIYSLPFLMVSVIVALMIPLIFQVVQFF